MEQNMNNSASHDSIFKDPFNWPKVKYDKIIYYHEHQYKYLWRACTERKTIINAWKKLRKGKTRRKDVIKIEENFSYYVDLMHETLVNTYPEGDENKSFKPTLLKPKVIFEVGKQRIIHCPPIWDQWVHHIIIQVLAPIIQKYSYKFSCGSMPKRGGIYGKREIERAIKKNGFKYYAKLDIRHFFNNIRLDVVLKELKIFIEDDRFIYLIELCFIQFKKKGLPLGFYISQWLANFLLCRMDWMIKRTKPITYVRYVDDLVMGANNKKYLHNLIIRIMKSLGKFRLRLKKNYQVIRFDYNNGNQRIGRPIDFMGFKFTRNNTILRKRVLYKTTKSVLKLSKLTYISVRQAQGFLSRIGWFKRTDTKYIWNKKIKRRVNIKSLKMIVSKWQRRYNNANRLDRGTLWLKTCRV
jgi:hypothetical protein